MPGTVNSGGGGGGVGIPNEPFAPSIDNDDNGGREGGAALSPKTPHANHEHHHHHHHLDRRQSLSEIPASIHRCPECGNACESCIRIKDPKRIHPDGDALDVEGMDAYGIMTPKASSSRAPSPRASSSRAPSPRSRAASVIGGVAITRSGDGEGHATSGEIEMMDVEEEDGSVSSESDEEGCCKTRFTVYEGLELRCLGMDFVFDVVLYALGAIFIGIAWLGLWTALPDELSEPAGAILGPASTIIVSTFIGQYIVSRSLGTPPIVGVFFTSIIWNHIYQVGFLSRGTFKVLRFVVSRLGLTTILVRAGMALSWKSIRPTVFYTTALSIIPLMVETVASAGLSYALFDEFNENWAWCFLHGFITSVIAAGIVAPELLSLVAQGYTKGPVPLGLSAVGFDTALGVWAIGFLNQLLFSDTEVGLLAGLGPVQLVGGVILGVFVGFLFCVLMRLLRRNMWRNPTSMRRFTLAYFLCIALGGVFFGEKFDLSGGGTMFALTFATSVGHMLEFEAQIDEKNLAKKMKQIRALEASIKDEEDEATTTNSNSVSLVVDGSATLDTTLRPGETPTSSGDNKKSTQVASTQQQQPVTRESALLAAFERGRHCAAMQRADLVLDLRDFWDQIVAGPLFSLSGTLVDLTKLFSVDFFPKGILIFGVGSVVRLVVTGLTVSFGLGFDWKEVIFMALAWFG